MSRISELARGADDITSRIVTVPEWGVDIEVRSMDGHKRATYLQNLSEARDNEEGLDREALTRTELELIIACSYDPDDHTQAFTDTDASWLLDKSGRVIQRLAAASLEMSGLAADSEEKVGKDSQD
jgi:hypothetical protein